MKLGFLNFEIKKNFWSKTLFFKNFNKIITPQKVADYENDSAHQIVSKDDYIAMKMTVTQLNEEITRLEGLPYQQGQRLIIFFIFFRKLIQMNTP